MAGPTFVKDPDARLDYHIDWTAWLAGDVITASTWASDDGVTLESPTILGPTTSIWVLGGTAGAVVSVRNRITTQEGRIEDRTIYLMLEQR